ncbi:MAG: type II secretion system protein [Patescibacteria group bacterium]
MLRNKKGFTLIELLVVITIIGLLSSLAVVSLSSARNKANDAKIKSDLTQLRSTIELNADASTDSPYSNASAVVAASVIKAPSCATGGYTLHVATPANSYSVSAQLCADNTHYFCIDSSGNATTTATAPSTSTCP